MAGTVESTLAERGACYGAFADHARLTQALKQVMQGAPGWSALTASQREALDMIQHKIARMLNGDPTYLDNAVDICGYAQLMLNDMQAAAEKPDET